MTEERRKKMDLPDRRANTYEALSNRLDAHVKKSEDHLSRWIRRGLVAYAIIGIACAVALVGFGIALDRITDNRELFVRAECEKTNQRNTDTSNQLIGLAAEDAQNRKTAAGKIEVQRRRDVTLALIDALAPVEDCDYQVDLALGRVTPTPTPSPTSTPGASP
jgi:hypothetical protein